MSAFDDLTLAEVEEIQNVALGGKAMSDASIDPMMLAGGVLWMTERRVNPELEWLAFKANTTMGAIKAFSAQIQADESESPLVSPNGMQR